MQRGRDLSSGRQRKNHMDGLMVIVPGLTSSVSWMAAESLLTRQGLRTTGGDGSHMTVEDAVSAQFAEDIPAFVKPTFERFRRTTLTQRRPRLPDRTRRGRLKRQRLRCPERENCWLIRRLISSLLVRLIESEHGTAGDGVMEPAGS